MDRKSGRISVRIADRGQIPLVALLTVLLPLGKNVTKSYARWKPFELGLDPWQKVKEQV